MNGKNVCMKLLAAIAFLALLLPGVLEIVHGRETVLLHILPMLLAGVYDRSIWSHKRISGIKTVRKAIAIPRRTINSSGT